MGDGGKEKENHAGTAMKLQEWRNVVLKDEIRKSAPCKPQISAPR